MYIQIKVAIENILLTRRRFDIEYNQQLCCKKTSGCCEIDIVSLTVMTDLTFRNYNKKYEKY